MKAHRAHVDGSPFRWRNVRCHFCGIHGDCEQLEGAPLERSFRCYTCSPKRVLGRCDACRTWARCLVVTTAQVKHAVVPRTWVIGMRCDACRRADTQLDLGFA